MDPTDHHKSLIKKYIQGDCTPAELAELQKFLSLPEAQLLFDEVLEENWTGLNAEANTDQPHLDQQLKAFYAQLHDQESIKLQEQPATRFVQLRKYLSYAAILAILVSGVGIYNALKAPKSSSVAQVVMQSVNNPKGQRARVTLPDSSEVFLGAGSKLSFPNKFVGKTREIRLEGEAFFQVTKNKHKPFIIHTGTVQTRVLGTSFKVEAFKGYPLVVAVATGRVRVDDYANHSHQSLAVLSPGQKVTYLKGAAMLATTSVTDVEGWKTARLAFEKEPLKVITAQLERWYNVNIIYNNPLKANEKISVVLHANVPLNKIMKVLGATGHFKYAINTKNVTIN